MFNWIDLFLAFMLGGMCTLATMAWLVQRWANRIRSMLEQVMSESAEPDTAQDLKDRVEQGRIVLLEVEVENDQFFCYNSKTRQFVCQGRNVTEIIEHFRQRFPGLNAVLHTGDETALTTLRQQLKQRQENEKAETTS